MEPKEDVSASENDQSSGVVQDENLLSTRRSLLRQCLEATAFTAVAMLGKDRVLAQTERKQQPLILRNDELAAKTDTLYKELKASPRLQSEFINDPSKVLALRFLPPNATAGISPQRLNNANRVLYSVIANNRFLVWLQEYQANIKKTGKVDKPQVIKDFSAAVVRYGDAALVQGIMEESALSATERQAFDVLVVYDAVIAIEFVAVAIVLPLIILGVNSSAYFTAADFRTLTEKMISKGREMERAGSLAESFIR